jgi:hypothetical protein
MQNLPLELLVSMAMVALTVVIHLGGLDLLLSLTELHLRLFKSADVRYPRLIVPLSIVLGLFAVHGLEIWSYAVLYLRLRMVPDLEQALFVSTSSYATLGEAHAGLPQAWRVTVALEGVNGMLLLGWSTAFLFQVLHHLVGGAEGRGLRRGVIARLRRREDEG